MAEKSRQGVVGYGKADRDFRHLPEPVDLEHTVAIKVTEPVPDPDGGLNPERDFTLRYSG